MKKIQKFLEEWGIEASLGISLRLSVSGFETDVLPTSDERGPLALNRVARLTERDLKEEELLLTGKLAFQRIQGSATASPEQLSATGELFAQPGPEIKNSPESRLPIVGVYAETALQVKAEAQIKEPIVLLLNNSLKGMQRLNLSVRYGAHVTVVIVSQMDVHSAQCVNLTQEEDSELELIWIPLQTREDSTLALRAEIGENARLKLQQPTLDNSVFFSNLIELTGDRSRVDTYAPTFAEQTQWQHIETTLIHKANKTYSRIHNHGVLNDRARGDFLGKQILIKGAKETDCYQTSRYLVMSDGVKAHTSPVLVIDDNEVVAGHAASVGRIDEEPLFYLQSRGLERRQAQRLMTAAFLRSYLEEIGLPSLRDKLTERLLKKVNLV